MTMREEELLNKVIVLNKQVTLLSDNLIAAYKILGCLKRCYSHIFDECSTPELLAQLLRKRGE